MTLKDLFDQIVTLVRETPVTPELAVSNEDKLRMYGLYKQATEGACEQTAPPVWQPVYRAKYEAWASYRDLETEVAIIRYVRVAARQNHWLGKKCRDLLEAYEQQGNSCQNNSEKDEKGNESHGDGPAATKAVVEKAPKITAPLSRRKTEPHLMERLFGLKPLIPRGQLDISYSELATAARHCLDSSSTPKRESCEQEIVELWKQQQEKSQQPKDQHVLVGLSVRSLLDLYLRAKTFMPGSEVIVVPPINIPAMMAILEYHGLAIVAVDLPESFANDHVLRIDVDQVKQAVTAKTAAIMVVHPFGIETATDSDMEQLRSLADEHGLDIIEDCAECYSGASSTTRPYADLALFSFGTIKTATALGSGVAVLRGPQLSIKMKRLHQSLYEPQTQAEFFWKVLKNAFIRLIADFPILCALILVACRWLGLDFDRLVSTSTRSFLASQQDNTPIRLIRRRPSLALLKTLKMKLRISKQIASSQKTKIQRCEKMMAMLQDCSALRWPKPVEKHSWWLAPILVTSPKETSRRLLQSGYDVPRGLSQLQCIAPACCPRAQLLMQSILYLPIASRSMTDSDMSSLAHAISVATDPDVADSKTETRPSRGYSAIAIALALVFVLWKTKSITGVLHLSISASLMAPALVLLNLAISCLLTFFIADAYLESGCFAKYNPMLRQIFDNDQKRDSQDAGLEDIPALRLPAFRTNESNQPSVLLTGATGFLGSSILHEMLMNRALMQSIDRVVLICRPKRGKSARQRINELLDQDMFSFLTKQERDEKILVLEGDTCKPDGGIAAKDLAVLFTDLKVQSVINCAASVRFSQGLDEAATANITAALYLQQLSLKLNAKFVHISTAFVHGGLTGTKSSPLTETLFSLDKFDADKIYRSMIGNQMYASLAMSTLGFHNTYTFSKCICEHLLLQTTPDDVVIVRPSIIGPALQEPFEGWAGQKPSTIVAATCLYMKFPFSVWSFGKHEASVIPVDVVARFVLAKALKGDDLASSQRLENRSECQSPASSEYEKVQGIGEVESLSSDSCSNDVDVRTAIEGFAPVICNAAWSSDSSACSSFSWYDFATSVPHVGIVLGGCPRVTAYLSFAISVKILPSLRLRAKQFAALYYFLLQVPFSAFVRLLEIAGLEKLHRKLSKLLPFLDLPVLFYPFTNNSFIFESALQAPQHLDGHRYMFTCIAAAHRFLYEMTPLSSTEKGPRTQLRDTSNILIGGKDHRKLNSDLWWALTQPRGNILVRLVGYLFAKILRSSCTAVSVDVESFAGIARQIVADDNKVVHVVLAPTHRSFYDFVLISFIAFSLPELRIQIPYIAAAQEFSSLPFLGWIIKHVNAFFVRRGRGRDPDLADQLRAMKTASKGRGTCIEVFIEGSRSRDRRFLEPKTGFLRCLVQTGGDHLIVPVCINYERVPEQDALVREGMGGTRRGLRTTGLLPWLWDTLNGKLQLGNIHIAAGTPVALAEHTETDFGRLATEIQDRQQTLIRISSYHIQAAELVLGLDKDLTTAALLQLGCKFWPTALGSDVQNGLLTSSPSDAWSVTMQFAHLIAPKLKESYAFWADWLCPFKPSSSNEVGEAESVSKLVHAFEDVFDRTEATVNQAIQELRRLGICRLSRDHVVHIARRHQKQEVPDELLHAYASMKVGDGDPPRKIDVANCRDLDVGNNVESLGMWGFKDSRFHVHPDSKGRPVVVLSGNRYGISGKPLKKLVPFFEAETKISIDVYKEPVGVTGLEVNECDFSVDDIKSIKSTVSRISLSPGARARHGTGHSQEEAYQLRRHGNVRVPDIVVWPSTESEVENLIKQAQEHSWNLIPHGGGTNVSQATKCPSKAADPRPIVSVDMTELKRVLCVNEEDGLAHVQAGITGRDLVEEMRRRGYTIGHEPDSLEFSTLGGWIATKASGMKRSKYGNIENIVVDIRVAGSAGVFWQGDSKIEATTAGRQSRGPDLLSFFLGSEGCLGIITSAVIRIWPLPPTQEYDSVLLGDFNIGLQFAQNASKLGPFMPASVRLLDNAHFRLGQALREETSFLESCGKTALGLMSPTFRSMSSKEMVCATILFEGSEDEVREQQRQIKRLARQHGGLLLGPSVGRSGYELTYVIAYLRDFALSFNFLGDSFETFAPWSKVQQVATATKNRIKEEHERRCLPGEVFVGCRVTQLYHDGACLYFYVCMYCGNVDDASAVFTEIEHSARQEILRHGGSLSHHHGIGKIRAEFLPGMDSKAFREGLVALKNGLDPSNTFGAGNGFFAPS